VHFDDKTYVVDNNCAYFSGVGFLVQWVGRMRRIAPLSAKEHYGAFRNRWKALRFSTLQKPAVANILIACHYPVLIL
jgi:hypothetical protein